MLTLRDHHSAAPSSVWIQLGAKRQQLLDRSWAGVFRDYLLLELPVGELAPHFSKDFGRPSKDLHVVLGALVLQQLHDLTDAQTVEATSAVSKVAKPDLITHMAVGKMTVHDSKALLPAIEDTKARGVASEHMVADTHYGSTQCIAQAKAKGVTLLAPAMSPKGKGQGKLTLEDFELDTSGHIQRCPAGHAPLETSVSKKRLQVRFAIDVCGQCPLQDRCPIKGKERLQYTHERVKQRARRLSEESDAFRDRYRWRAGIEGTISRLKHQMGLAHLRVRGQGAVQYRVLLRALGLNIHRVAVWRGHFTLKNFLVGFWGPCDVINGFLDRTNLYQRV